MELTYEQKQKEIMYCMIYQGYFSLKVYEEEMKKLEQDDDFPCLFKEIMRNVLHNIIREKIDEIIKGDESKNE